MGLAMRKISLYLTILLSFLLFACGGGGGGSSSDTVKVKLNIDQSSFARDARSIAYGGKLIEKIELDVTNLGQSIYDVEIQDSVEAGTGVELTLVAYATYTFSITAIDADGNDLCSGSDSAYIGKNSVNTVNIVCADNGEPVFVAGIAASGLPIDGIVYLKDSVGTVKMANIGDDGSFQIDVSDMIPPYIMRAEGKVGDKQVTLYSASSGAGDTANINPYSNLALSIAVGGLELGDVFSDPTESGDLLGTDNLKEAVDVVRNIFTSMFAAMGVADFDPINGQYSADGSGMDGVLDNLSINVSGGNINIVNVNTGASVVSVSVANAGSATIPASVATEVASYVSEGPNTFEAVKAFLNDYLFNRSRSYSSYFSASMDWLNGLTRASLIATTTFPASSSLSSLEDVSIVKRNGLDHMTVYYVVKNTDGTLSANTAWLVRENGIWYFDGNGIKFTKMFNPIALMSKTSSSETVSSGIEFFFVDNGLQGITRFVVKGAGLPSAGLEFYQDYYEYKITGGSNAPKPFIYLMSDAQVNTVNSEFMINGFVKYEIEAYTNNGLLQTDEYNLRVPLFTSTELTNKLDLFVTLENVTSYDLNSILSTTSGTMQTSMDNIDDYSYGLAVLDCEDANSTEYNFASATISPTSPDFTYSVDSGNAPNIDSCAGYLVYHDTIFRKYLSYMTFTDSSTPDPFLTGVANGLTFDDIQGSNTVISSVTSNLSLPSIISGVSVTWVSSLPNVISNAGVVAQDTRFDYTVTLTATLTYNGSVDFVIFNITVPSSGQGDVSPTAASLDANELTEDVVLGINQKSTEIIYNMNFPTIGTNGSTILCSSNSKTYIDDTGELLRRPTVSTGDITASIVCAVDSEGENIIKTFNVVVPTAIPKHITAESSHNLYVAPDDSLWGWGSNAGVQLGAYFPDGVTSVPTTNTTPVELESNGTIFIAVDGGDNHSIAIKDDGTLWGVGNNSYRQLLYGITPVDGWIELTADTDSDSYADTDWVQVSSDYKTTHALKADGTLWGAGYNASGQIGDGSKLDRNLLQIGTDTDWAYVDNGNLFTVAIKTDGSVYSWGENSLGQLCNGTQTDSTAPQPVDSNVKFIKVSADYNSTLLLSEDGEIYGCGTNTGGELGSIVGTITTPTKLSASTDWVDIAIGEDFAAAVNSSGELYTWGSNTYGALGSTDADDPQLTPYKIGEGYTAVYAGSSHIIGVQGGIAISSWGWNYYGQIGDETTVNRETPYLLSFYADGNISPTNVINQLALSEEHSVITGNGLSGTFYGDSSHGESGLVDEASILTGSTVSLPDLGGDMQVATLITSIATGLDFTAYLGVDRTVYFYGTAEDGQGLATLSDADIMNGIGQISAGYEHVVGINGDGMVMAFGRETDGQLGQLGPVDTFYYNVVEIPFSAGGIPVKVFAGAYSTFIIDVYANLYALGKNDSGQLGMDTSGNDVGSAAAISETGDWKFISSGLNHTLGLRVDGSLWAWGNNGSGQLGIDSLVNMSTPTKVDNNVWISVATGKAHSVGVKADGTLWSWGSDSFYQLGSIGASSKTIPTQVGTDSDWLGVVAGGDNSIAVKTDGTIFGWGNNSNGELGTEDTNPVATPTAISGLTLDILYSTTGGMEVAP